MEKGYLYMIQLLIKRKKRGKEKKKKKKGKKKKKRKKKGILITHQRKSLSQTSLCQGPQEHADSPS